jgi:hypothetical protein
MPATGETAAVESSGGDMEGSAESRASASTRAPRDADAV